MWSAQACLRFGFHKLGCGAGDRTGQQAARKKSGSKLPQSTQKRLGRPKPFETDCGIIGQSPAVLFGEEQLKPLWQ